eukprot:5129537-Amphidinium_carterae.2
MRDMENAPNALDFDLYVEEKKKETVALYFRLVVLTDKTALGIVKQVGNQDGFEAYRRLAVRHAPRTLESDVRQDSRAGTADRGARASLRRENRRLSEVCGKPAGDAHSTEDLLLVNSRNASDWTTMRRSIQSYLLVTASAPKPIPMDLGYFPWSNKGKGKYSKGKGHKGDNRKGDENSWWNNGGKTRAKAKENSKVADQATEEKAGETVDEILINPIMVNDRKMVEIPVAEVSTKEGHYGVEAMLDSGAGASVCSPNDFPTVAIDTKTEVTKVYRCADGRELRVYG